MTAPEYRATRSIAALPDRIWKAIVDPVEVVQYHLAPLRVIELTRGGRISYGSDDEEMIFGKILEVVPGKRLTHTFRFSPAVTGTTEDPETSVSYRIEPEGHGSKLTLLHLGFPGENQTYANISGGWPCILDALQAFVER